MYKFQHTLVNQNNFPDSLDSFINFSPSNIEPAATRQQELFFLWSLLHVHKSSPNLSKTFQTMQAT